MQIAGPPCAVGRCGRAAARGCRCGATCGSCEQGEACRSAHSRTLNWAGKMERSPLHASSARSVTSGDRRHAAARDTGLAAPSRPPPPPPLTAAAARPGARCPQVVSKHSAVPEAQGLFNTENDKDSCGVGFVAGARVPAGDAAPRLHVPPARFCALHLYLLRAGGRRRRHPRMRAARQPHLCSALCAYRTMHACLHMRACCTRQPCRRRHPSVCDFRYQQESVHRTLHRRPLPALQSSASSPSVRR